MAKQCELIIGYLLPRRCEEKGVAACQKCERTVCELHTRMADQGLLCRDCHEEGQPREAGAVPLLPEPVHDVIYRRGDFSSLGTDDDDFALFDGDEGDAFSTLS
jgi:hypothetical protein